MPRLLRRLLLGYLLALIALYVAVSWWSSGGFTSSLVPASDERGAVLERLRADVEGRPHPSVSPATAWRGWASLYCGGRMVLRRPLASRPGEGLLVEGFTLASDKQEDPAGCRIKVDVELGRGPLATWIPLALAFSFVPGLDGIGARLGDREVVLLPDDLVAAEIFGSLRPIPDVDVDGGLDGRALIALLARRSGLDAAAWRAARPKLFRVRTTGLIEPRVRPGPPLSLARSLTPVARPEVRRSRLRESAVAAGTYLLEHQRGDGSFAYEYHLIGDQGTPTDGQYSLPRHAGATGFLAQLHGATAEPRIGDGARRALRFLAAQAHPGCPPSQICLVQRDVASEETPPLVEIGSSALALVAAVDYRRATGSDEFDDLARGLASFLAGMQRPDGEFDHLLWPAGGRRDPSVRLLYFSGEAALALARYGTVDPAYREPAARAVTRLTDGASRTLAEQYFFGEDHWTCLAADAAWDFLSPAQKEQAGDFCADYVRFLGRSQFVEGEGPTTVQPDLRGGYAFTPLLPIHVAPVGSRGETLVSVHAIALRRGRAAEAAAILEQLEDTLAYLLQHQVSDDTAYLAPNPAGGRGGFVHSLIHPVVRIDYQQHCGSAILRSSSLFGD